MHRNPWFCALAVGTVTLLILSLPGVRPSGLSGPVEGFNATTTLGVATAPSLPAVFSLPFAERAGYHLSPPLITTALAPASGVLRVDLTFVPRSSSLFTPPAIGAPPLAAEQIRSSYGLSPADELAVLQYFERYGLTPAHVWPDGLMLSLSGSAEQVSAAFHTQLVTGLDENHLFSYPSTPPWLPSNLEGKIASVSGLDSGFSTFTLPFEKAGARLGPSNTGDLVYPSSLHVAYGLDGLYNYSGSSHFAGGVGVALLLWGDGYAPSDIQTFYSSYYPSGFPAPTLTAYPVDGAPPPSAGAWNDPSGGPQELTLDLEWSGSEAPGASLDAVYAPDGPSSQGYSPTDATMEDALNTALLIPGVRVVSMSFGASDGGDPAFQAAYSMLFATAQSKQITLLAASGDNGGDMSPACTGGPDPQFPAASPAVIAVGGTAPVFSRNIVQQVTGIASEPAWNRSGGGFSVTYPAPTWQLVGSAGPVIQANGNRGLPDVSGPAAFNFFYFHGSTLAGGGTSFAAPMWGGLIAEMDAIRGSSFGFVTPRIYQVAAQQEAAHTSAGIVDVTTGANCVVPAGPGWDLATGWGTPRALTLYEELSGSFVNLAIQASPPTVAPGGSVTLTVSVINATSLQPISGETVNLVLSAGSYTGPCGGTLSTASPVTNSSGDASASLSVPGCFVGSSATATATVSSNGFFGQASTTISVGLAGFSAFLQKLEQYPYNILTFVLLIAAAVSLGWYLGRPKKPAIAPSEVPPGVQSAPPPPAAPTPPPPPASPPTSAASPMPPPSAPPPPFS